MGGRGALYRAEAGGAGHSHTRRRLETGHHAKAQFHSHNTVLRVSYHGNVPHLSAALQAVRQYAGESLTRGGWGAPVKSGLSKGSC